MKPLYWVGYTLCGTIARIAFQYRAFGQENLIEEGPAIMAANHQSYLDPPLVGITCRNELYYLARKTLFEKKLFGPIIARNLRENRPKPYTRWHRDEMVVSIAGRQMLEWSFVAFGWSAKRPLWSTFLRSSR